MNYTYVDEPQFLKLFGIDTENTLRRSLDILKQQKQATERAIEHIERQLKVLEQIRYTNDLKDFGVIDESELES